VKAPGEQGWTDAESILALVMLNLVGGDCVEDVDRLESDEDFADCLARRCVRVEPKGLEGLKKRWRKRKRAGCRRVLRCFDILSEFHDRDQRIERAREAFIPLPMRRSGFERGEHGSGWICAEQPGGANGDAGHGCDAGRDREGECAGVL